MGFGRLGRRVSRTQRRVERTAQRDAGRSPPASSLISRSVLDRPCQHRWPPRWTLLPPPTVPQNLLDHLGLAPLDEADDAHRRAALGTAEGIRFVHLPDQGGPAFTGFRSRGRAGRCPSPHGGRSLPLVPLPSGLVRIPPIVPDQVFAGLGDVLRDFGQEIQGIEHLEVARGPGQQFPVARLGESPHRIVLGLVDHLAGFGHLDHAGLGERAPQKVLDDEIVLQRNPVACRGIGRTIIPGRVELMDVAAPVGCGGVLVRPGDIVGCDWDGVVVVPIEVAEDVLCIAARIAVDDKKARRRLYDKLGRKPAETVDWEATAAYFKDLL